MGLIAAMSSATRDGSIEVSGVQSGSLSSFGVPEVTGIVVAVALLYLLAWLNLLEAAESDDRTRQAVFSLVVPLAIVFAGIVIYHSLESIGWLGAA